VHDIRDLAAVVEQMLTVRMEYIRTRNETAKQSFERLEKNVRAMCNEVLRSGQQDLFDGNG
jgi:phosphate uptake regulator